VVDDIFTERGRTADLAWARTRPEIDLLALHGFSDSADCYAPLIGALGDGWGVLAIDARGHGGSGWPGAARGGTTGADDAATVLAAQEGVGAAGVVVIGHSMGAATAAMLAAIHPELVRAILLEDPPTYQPGSGSLTVAPAVPDWLTATRALDRKSRIANCRRENPDWPEDELEPWAISKEQFDPRFFELPFVEPVPLAETIANVRCPVLFVYGDPERGSINGPESAAEYAAATTAEFHAVHIAGAGHSVHRDRRAPFLQALRDFLRPYRR
jgi:pimeloyl-ACP methyl ester carboxylesterase